MAAHGEGEADDFVDGFTFYAQGDQQGGDLFGAGVAGKDLLHRGFGLQRARGLRLDEFVERFVDHFWLCS